MSPRDLGERALTCVWDTASSTFTEAGGQETFSASVAHSQDPLLNHPQYGPLTLGGGLHLLLVPVKGSSWLPVLPGT